MTYLPRYFSPYIYWYFFHLQIDRMENDKDGNSRTLEYSAPLVIAHKPIITPEILSMNISGTLTQV